MVDCLLTKENVIGADQLIRKAASLITTAAAEDSTDKAKTSKEPYSVLLAPGKNPDSARQGGQTILCATRNREARLLDERMEETGEFRFGSILKMGSAD